MQQRFRKNICFVLICFFSFAYQFANFSPSITECKTVKASPAPAVIPGGQAIGVNINVGGIMVVGSSDFEGEDGKRHCPIKEAGIKKGDIIISVNNVPVATSSEFSGIVDQCSGEKILVKFMRDGVEKSTFVNAVKSAEDGKFRLGLWARDGTTGIGTLTFVNPETDTFGALGHGVSDPESGDLIEGYGNVYFASVSDIQKNSHSGIGEMQGCFISSEIGVIEKNTELGIYGTFDAESMIGKPVQTASRQEVKTGGAKIYCCIDGNCVESFDVIIEKVDVNSNDNKSMVIRITDENLLNQTGGIVQGMSGSPILQNGKLIGAVTHVFVNDPTRGYGIFIENMLEEAEKIK